MTDVQLLNRNGMPSWMVLTGNRGGIRGRRGLEWMTALERLSARETPGWRRKPSGGGNEPGRGEAGGRAAGRQGSRVWLGRSGKMHARPRLARSAELIQSWSFNRKEKGTMREVGSAVRSRCPPPGFLCGTFNLRLRTAFITF